MHWLSTCLEQTRALIHDVTLVRPLPKVSPAGQLLARSRRRDGEWETTFIPFPTPLARPSLEVDELALERLRLKYRGTSQTWEAAVQTVAPIAEPGAAPYWAWTLLCVERSSGFVLANDIAGPGESVQRQFVKVVERFGSLPTLLHVASGLLQSQLAPLAGPLDMEVRLVKRLPELEKARRFFEKTFRRR